LFPGGHRHSGRQSVSRPPGLCRTEMRAGKLSGAKAPGNQYAAFMTIRRPVRTLNICNITPRAPWPKSRKADFQRRFSISRMRLALSASS
jgi:hypothetical protein